MDTDTALRLLLDHVDYTTGACRPTDMVSATLPPQIISLCRQAQKQARPKRETAAPADPPVSA